MRYGKRRCRTKPKCKIVRNCKRITKYHLKMYILILNVRLRIRPYKYTYEMYTYTCEMIMYEMYKYEMYMYTCEMYMYEMSHVQNVRN